MAYQNTNTAVSAVPKAQPIASIQDASVNGMNFNKTNCYANNDAHMLFINKATEKAVAGSIVPDDKGITTVQITVNQPRVLTVRLYGDKPAIPTEGLVELS